ncbi:MAG TPA: polysaccharide deacetylase family protein, partial [Rudaea sp.]
MMRSRIVAALGLLLLWSAQGRAESLAITFDDLPLNGDLPPGLTRAQIATDAVAILRRRHLPPSYGFVNAQKLEGSDDGAQALRIWVAGGQRVGNHGYAHLDLHKNTPELFIDQVRQDEPALELLDPHGTWRWFRYPFLREGDTLDKRHAVRAALRDRNYRIAQVTLDYEDYLWNSAYAHCVAANDARTIAWLRESYLDIAHQYIAADRAMAQLVFGHPINHVLLLHLGAFSKTILPDLLDLLRREGFTFVPLEQAQSDPAYATDPDAPSKYGGTLIEQWMDARGLTYPPIAKKPYKQL